MNRSSLLGVAIALSLAGCGDSGSDAENAGGGGSSGSAGNAGTGGTGGSGGSAGTGGAAGAAGTGGAGGVAGTGGTSGSGGTGGTSGSGGTGGTGGSGGAPPSSVDVVFHPGATVSPGAPTTFAFGLPLPPDAVDEVGAIVLQDAASQEVATHVVETTRWRSLGSASESVRSATVWTTLTFQSTDPVVYHVALGGARTLELGAQGDVRDHWVSIAQGPFPDEYSSTPVLEPPVYATLPSTWLGACRLRTNTTPIDENGPLGWFDTSFLGYSRTAVNDVEDHVTPDNLIDYEIDYDPWLFDRAMTIFGAYARTGDVAWLRHAHRAAQFYASHVNAAGYFDLKTPNDLKYSYGDAMLIDLMLTGDTTLSEPIERVASAGVNDGFNVAYSISSNFWTERHLAYTLLAALSAWELTGSAVHGDRVKQIISVASAHAQTPPGGWSVDGCLLHTMESHEGSSDTSPVCSPWMSALLGDAIWRYYLHSGDDAALVLLSGFGDFLVNHGTYVAEEGDLAGMTVPYYLASSVLQFTDSGPWDDVEHTCDVMGLAARAAWAKAQLGQDNAVVTALTDALQVGCEWNLDHWHRDGQATIDAGLTVWRLSPPRKYNWWFGTTSDYGWLRANL